MILEPDGSVTQQIQAFLALGAIVGERVRLG
jgi:hypothetical protein